MPTVKEVLDAFADADKGLVESWNRDFGWGRQPHVEDHIGFIKARQENTMKALAMIAQALIDQEAGRG